MKGFKTAFGLAACAVAMLVVNVASAQAPTNYPNRPLRIIVPTRPAASSTSSRAP